MTQHIPTIVDYLFTACAVTVDDYNLIYGHFSKSELKEIAYKQFTETDVVKKISELMGLGVHCNLSGHSSSNRKKNNDIYVVSRQGLVEVKYLRNWNCKSNTPSVSKPWSEYKADFDWLIEELKLDNRNNRAFTLGWFNCVDSFSQIMQLGEGAGYKPTIREERLKYFPFLYQKNNSNYTIDLTYNYDLSYTPLPIRFNGIQKKTVYLNCVFMGNPNDCFHFAIYY